eukprot:11178975-Lingulodinium_polyedra.AAC.1
MDSYPWEMPRVTVLDRWPRRNSFEDSRAGDNIDRSLEFYLESAWRAGRPPRCSVVLVGWSPLFRSLRNRLRAPR